MIFETLFMCVDSVVSLLLTKVFTPPVSNFFPSSQILFSKVSVPCSILTVNLTRLFDFTGLPHCKATESYKSFCFYDIWYRSISEAASIPALYLFRLLMFKKTLQIQKKQPLNKIATPPHTHTHRQYSKVFLLHEFFSLFSWFQIANCFVWHSVWVWTRYWFG